ncbi:hypothetical protein [Amycolatopsis sp.]|nr:hypothetical protein [Amycolatopsis sp.]HVV07855.1 hypothetical protein [Amycolatopsis sp.]
MQRDQPGLSPLLAAGVVVFGIVAAGVQGDPWYFLAAVIVAVAVVT